MHPTLDEGSASQLKDARLARLSMLRIYHVTLPGEAQKIENACTTVVEFTSLSFPRRTPLYARSDVL